MWESSGPTYLNGKTISLTTSVTTVKHSLANYFYPEVSRSRFFSTFFAIASRWETTRDAELHLSSSAVILNAFPNTILELC